MSGWPGNSPAEVAAKFAFVYSENGKHEASGMMNRRALDMNEKASGKEHQNALVSMGNLACVLGKLGKYEEAEEMHRQTLAEMEAVLGKEHPDTLWGMNNLAAVIW